MKNPLCLFALVVFPVLATAGESGRPAYPDRWSGGPPLPALAASEAPRMDAYSVYPLAPAPMGATSHMQAGTAEIGDSTADCIRSNLKGTHWQDGCRKLNLSPAQAADLRGKYLQ